MSLAVPLARTVCCRTRTSWKNEAMKYDTSRGVMPLSPSGSSCGWGRRVRVGVRVVPSVHRKAAACGMHSGGNQEPPSPFDTHLLRPTTWCCTPVAPHPKMGPSGRGQPPRRSVPSYLVFAGLQVVELYV